MSEPDQHRIDRRAARRAFSVASPDYDGIAVLQAEVRARLLERLEVFKLKPEVVIDLGCGTGAATTALQQRYAQAHVIAMDAAVGMVQQAAKKTGWLQRLMRHGVSRVCADAFQLPVKDASVDVVFSNLMLQWCDPPHEVFAEVRRVLKPTGVFIFSSFGPDTLKELRAAWAAVDQYTHVNRFIDMHDLGDAMLRSGLAEPVLDVDRITMTYGEVMTLMRELKAIGAHNVNAGRAHGLTGRAALNKMIAAYELQRRDAVLPATYEVVYGQAWGNQPRERAAMQSEVRIPINKIGRRA